MAEFSQNQQNTEDPYSNREIREMFGDIQKSLTRIEAQTTKTNGRVTDIEKREEGKKGAGKVWFYLGLPAGLTFLGWAGWLTAHVFKSGG